MRSLPTIPAAAIVLFLLGLIEAAGGQVAAAAPPKLSVTATPRDTLSTQPFALRVTGAAAGAAVTLALSATDANGVQWSSSATFSADRSGRVNTATSAATGGDYHGVRQMGLFDALHSSAGTTVPFYWRVRSAMFLTVTAQSSGRPTAEIGAFRSLVGPGVTCQHETLAGEGFDGESCAPSGAKRGPAILQIGGSQGGISALLGPPIASAGYPVLNTGYFKLPGLPQTLSNIPLEYFAMALRWLDRQPDVNPKQVFVMGGSRGSEAAELLGVHYPTLVHGVIALSPSAIAFGSYPAGGGAAWTFQGRPVPYSSSFSADIPVQDPVADIQVQDIHGPMLFACGARDQEWTSCAYATVMIQRLVTSHDHYPHKLYAYPEAGHFINELIPYQPLPLYVNTQTASGADLAAANQAGATSLWAHFLNFLPEPAN